MDTRIVTTAKISYTNKDIYDFLTIIVTNDISQLETFLKQHPFTSEQFENLLDTKLNGKSILVRLRQYDFIKHLDLLYDHFKKIFVEQKRSSLYWDLFFGRPLKDIIDQRNKGKEFYHPNHISRFDDLNEIAVNFALEADRADFLEHLVYTHPMLEEKYGIKLIEQVCSTNQPSFFDSHLPLFKATKTTQNSMLQSDKNTLTDSPYDGLRK